MSILEELLCQISSPSNLKRQTTRFSYTQQEEEEVQQQQQQQQQQ